MNEISLSGCLVIPNSEAADAVPRAAGPACYLARAQVTTFNCG